MSIITDAIKIPFLLFLMQLLTAPTHTYGFDIVYPTDAGIINVTNYGVVGNGTTDNTDAINRLLSRYNNSDTQKVVESTMGYTFYFPAGTYLVSGTLQAIDLNTNEACGITLCGAGVDRTVIKLKSGSFNASGSTNPVIALLPKGSLGPASGYANFVRDLTVEIDTANTHAIGISAQLANYASIKNVKIKTVEPAYAGLLIYSRTGPGLIKDTVIEGPFLKGITCEWPQVPTASDSRRNNIVLENIIITNYQTFGVNNRGKMLQMRNIDIGSTNSGSRYPVYLAGNIAMSQTVIDKIRITIPAGITNSAYCIDQTNAFLYLRDSIVNRGGGSPECIDEEYYIAGIYKDYEKFNSFIYNDDNKSLRIFAKDSPDYYTPVLTNWVCVTNFGARPDDTLDDTCGIQAALNSGHEIVYLPFGTYHITNNLVVNNPRIKKIQGFHSFIDVTSAQNAIVLSNANELFVIKDLVTYGTIRQSSGDALSIINLGAGGVIENTTNGTGDIYGENLCSHTKLRVQNGVNVYLRQFDREHFSVTNNGAVIWCLGENVEEMEDGIQPWITLNGGVTEILGGAIDANEHPANNDYLYRVSDNSKFFIVNSGTYVPQDNYGWDYVISNNFKSITNNMSGGEYLAVSNCPITGSLTILPYSRNPENILALYTQDAPNGNQTLTARITNENVTVSPIVTNANLPFVTAEIFDEYSRSRQIHGLYMNAGTNFPTLVASNKYVSFTITPTNLMDIHGLSFMYMATNNAYTNGYTFVIYITDGNTNLLGSVVEPIALNQNSGWKKAYIHFDTNPLYKAMKTNLEIRLYFGMSARSYQCLAYIDNIAVHGSAYNELVFYDFDTNRDLTQWDTNNIVGTNYFRQWAVNGSLSNKEFCANASATSNNIDDALATQTMFTFTLEPKPGREVDLKELTFDMKAAGVGTQALTFSFDIQSSIAGYGKYKTIETCTGTFLTTNDSKSIKINLDTPRYKNISTAKDFRFYITDNQTNSAYRPAIDNVRLTGTGRSSQ